jgi:hypothetical protein
MKPAPQVLWRFSATRLWIALSWNNKSLVSRCYESATVIFIIMNTNISDILRFYAPAIL